MFNPPKKIFCTYIRTSDFVFLDTEQIYHIKAWTAGVVVQLGQIFNKASGQSYNKFISWLIRQHS